MNLYILCGNATFNRGDRVNLLGQIQLLKHKFPDADITVDSFRPEVDQAWYGVRVVKRSWFLSPAQIHFLWKADIVIWGGGALVADNACKALVPWWFLIIGFVRFVLRKRIIAWAHGVVLETKIGRYFAKRLYEMVETISLRDHYSYDLVRSFAPSKPMHLTADAVACLQCADADRGREVLQSAGVRLAPGSPVFAVCLTFWAFYSSRHDWLPYMVWPRLKSSVLHSLARHNQGVAHVMRCLIDQYDARILLLPRYPCAPWNDLRYLREIARHVQRPGKVFVFDNDKYPPDHYVSLFHHVDCVIATAMHDAMVATMMERPCVNLYYEDKGREFFAALGLADYMHSWDCLFDGGDAVLKKVDARLTTWDASLPELRTKIQAFRQRAELNLELLCKIRTNKPTSITPL